MQLKNCFSLICPSLAFVCVSFYLTTLALLPLLLDFLIVLSKKRHCFLVLCDKVKFKHLYANSFFSLAIFDFV